MSELRKSIAKLYASLLLVVASFFAVIYVSLLFSLQPSIYVKNFNFVNGCKANNETYKTAKILLTSNIHGAFIIAIDLRNSLLALHTNAGLICQLLCNHMEYSIS